MYNIKFKIDFEKKIVLKMPIWQKYNIFLNHKRYNIKSTSNDYSIHISLHLIKYYTLSRVVQ